MSKLFTEQRQTDIEIKKSEGYCLRISLFITSGLFLEADAAAAAGDGDLALALGDTELLAAVGTFEIAVILIPAAASVHVVFADQGAGGLQESGVLRPAALQLAGEHAVEGPQDGRQGQVVEHGAAKEAGQQVQDAIKSDQGKTQLVGAIAARHQTPKPVHVHTPIPYISIGYMIIVWNGKVKKENVNKV